MSESFEDMPSRKPPQSEKSKIRPENSILKEDEMIKNEIDKIGEDYLNSTYTEIEGDYKKEVEKIKNTRDKIERITAYIDAYIGKYPNKVNKEMSLNDFTDIINNESDFNTSIRDLINRWLDDHEGKINLEKSLGFFLSSILEEWMEYQKLLDPGPEETEENKE